MRNAQVSPLDASVRTLYILRSLRHSDESPKHKQRRGNADTFKFTNLVQNNTVLQSLVLSESDRPPERRQTADSSAASAIAALVQISHANEISEYSALAAFWFNWDDCVCLRWGSTAEGAFLQGLPKLASSVSVFGRRLPGGSGSLRKAANAFWFSREVPVSSEAAAVRPPPGGRVRLV